MMDYNYLKRKSRRPDALLPLVADCGKAEPCADVKTDVIHSFISSAFGVGCHCAQVKNLPNNVKNVFVFIAKKELVQRDILQLIIHSTNIL